MMNTLEKEISPRRLLLRSSLRPMEKAVEYKRALTAAKLEKAENSYGDITDKVVPDFGCGCGTLSVAAALLDSASVIGFDIDPQSLETATLNAEELEVEIDFIQCDITKLELKDSGYCSNEPSI
ncbi:PREDICTED: methyltransferase-like protein 5 isoform X1 [Camelina sativa]|uniref:Methyltransferase-like protein 5 isoform X1 n=1 Tax=Camelina sativa TaxID=90675 RepID=A0ABM1RD43_CAMSA|nr:PREDICTED: methyltransferase-like protein 5 isoform X1 [Camelina sativa]